MPPTRHAIRRCDPRTPRAAAPPAIPSRSCRPPLLILGVDLQAELIDDKPVVRRHSTQLAPRRHCRRKGRVLRAQQVLQSRGHYKGELIQKSHSKLAHVSTLESWIATSIGMLLPPIHYGCDESRNLLQQRIDLSHVVHIKCGEAPQFVCRGSWRNHAARPSGGSGARGAPPNRDARASPRQCPTPGHRSPPGSATSPMRSANRCTTPRSSAS